MTQEDSKLISILKKIFVIVCVTYVLGRYFLVTLFLKNQGHEVGFAVIAMGLTLIITWVILGGLLQRKILVIYYTKLTTPTRSPVIYFTLFATLLACLEEIITVTITNLAPLYGVSIGQAYITASTNYFDVIFLHSIIVFVPMFITLGFILKKYDISPFKALIIWGIVGVSAEAMAGGAQDISTAVGWVFVYGLMVYLPAHIFVTTIRKKPFFLLYPFFIIAIVLSAITTIWIPKALNHPSIHFDPITTLLQ